VHADESSFSHYHYSAVLYLASQGDAFEGGDFVFLDADDRSPADALGVTSRYAPRAGRALVFSSGWENVHYVDVVTAGTRFAMPVFFGTAAAHPTANDVSVVDGAEDGGLGPMHANIGDDDDNDDDWEPDACIQQLCEYWSSPTFAAAADGEADTGGSVAQPAAPHTPIAPWLSGVRSWMHGGS